MGSIWAPLALPIQPTCLLPLPAAMLLPLSLGLQAVQGCSMQRSTHRVSSQRSIFSIGWLETQTQVLALLALVTGQL